MISVVIPTHGKALLLERTLLALHRQSGVGDWEIVVVDDASADETPVLLRYWERQLPLRVVRHPRNLGRARARNRGWREARGETVLFLDDDILLERWAVAAHSAAQRRRPAVYIGEVHTAPEIVDSRLFAYLDSRGIAKHRPGDRVPARYLLTQNVSLPRRALEVVGGFDEDFGAYGFEDMELAFRLEDTAQLEFFFLDGARGAHVHHHSEVEYFAKKRECGRFTLPRIARLHPHRLAEMQLDLVVSPLDELKGRRRCLARALRVSFRMGGCRVAGAVQRLCGALLGPAVEHRLYDYRVLQAYFQGLQEAQGAKDVQGPGSTAPLRG